MDEREIRELRWANDDLRSSHEKLTEVDAMLASIRVNELRKLEVDLMEQHARLSALEARLRSIGSRFSLIAVVASFLSLACQIWLLLRVR